jgi:hypothetical protein
MVKIDIPPQIKNKTIPIEKLVNKNYEISAW